MFYAHFVLSKRGPLARIWLAAHWDKKLTKAAVFETNIDSSVEAILQPKVKLALRTSGHLLLGVVRIYSRKAKYLLADCNEAFVKIKMAFRPGIIELSEDNREAAVAAITLPENFHDFDTTMAELDNIDMTQQFTVNQSRPEEITMKEDVSNITYMGDDGFGDLGFDESSALELPREMEKTLTDTTLTEEERQTDGLTADSVYMDTAVDDDDDDDGAADDFGGDMDDELFGGHSGLFAQDPVTEPVPFPDDISMADTTRDDTLGEAMSPAAVRPAEAPSHVNSTAMTTQVGEQTTLLSNEQSAFVLEPVQISALPATERRQPQRRKRKLIVDEQKALASDAMKVQLSDTTDIVCPLDLAPPTKQLMMWKETGGVDKLFALPSRSLPAKALSKLYTANLITCAMTLHELDERAADKRLSLDESVDVLREQTIAEEPSAAALDDTVVNELNQADDTLTAPRPDVTTDYVTAGDDVTLNDITAVSAVEMPELPSDLAVELPSELAEESRVEAPTSPQQAPVAASPAPQPAADTEDGEPADKRTRVDEQPTTPTADVPQFDRQDLDSDDNDAYGPLSDEEGGDVAATEQKLNARSEHFFSVISQRLGSEEQVSLHQLCRSLTAKQAASRFYSVLLLKKHDVIDVAQYTQFGDTMITRGPRFESVSAKGF